MSAAVRSELRKIASTKVWWIVALIAFVYTGFTEAVLAWTFHLSGTIDTGMGTPLPAGSDLALLIYSAGSSFGYVFPALLGALLVTTEYRYATITPSFLADPVRWRGLVAKLIAVVPYALGYGLVVLAASVGLGGGSLWMTGQATGLSEGRVWEYLLRCVLAMTIWGLVGVGLGALVKNQMVAIVGLLAFTQFLEPLLRMIPLFTGRSYAVLSYLPGAVGDAITGTSLYDAIAGGVADPLSFGMALVVLIGYAGLLSAAGYFTTIRRDVG